MGELKEWLKNRKESPRTIRELANIFHNIPYKTVAGWVHKDSIPKDKEIRRKLYELTNINKYKVSESIERSKKFEKEITIENYTNLLIKDIEYDLNQILLKLSLLKSENKEIQIEDYKSKEIMINIKKIIYECFKTLTPLINNENLRKKFREEINKNDIAMLSSLLEALLDEKKFKIWLIFKNIELKEKK